MMITPLSLSVADISAVDEQGTEYQQPQQYAAAVASEKTGTTASFSTHVTAVHPAVNHHVVTTMQPTPPSFVVSPSKNPCMVRVDGAKGTPDSRYRNDPYGCSVLPPLQGAPGQQQVSNRANRRLAPLPPGLHLVAPSRLASRAKVDITRAKEFALDDGLATSSVADSHQQILPAQPAFLQQSSFLHHSSAQQQQQQQQPAHFTSPPNQRPPQKQHHQQVAPIRHYQQQQHPNRLEEQQPNPSSSYNGPRWAMIRLKHELLLYNISFPLKEDEFVVLEGDRGENIGRVHSLIHEEPQHPVQCRVCRIANDADIDAVRVQRQKEEAAKHFAQGVSDALQLGIRVVDTEFQTDGNKLTVYFTARRQIDFRRLQRQMFKQYRCRIWLVNWTDVVKA